MIPFPENRKVFRICQIPIPCFLIAMKFTSKLLWILLMGNVSSPVPHLRKIMLKTYTHNLYMKLFSQNKYFGKITSRDNFRKNWWVCRSRISTIFKFSDSQTWNNNMFERWFHHVSCIFWNILVIIGRYTGPYFDKIFEVHNMI